MRPDQRPPQLNVTPRVIEESKKQPLEIKNNHQLDAFSFGRGLLQPRDVDLQKEESQLDLDEQERVSPVAFSFKPCKYEEQRAMVPLSVDEKIKKSIGIAEIIEVK